MHCRLVEVEKAVVNGIHLLGLSLSFYYTFIHSPVSCVPPQHPQDVVALTAATVHCLDWLLNDVYSASIFALSGEFADLVHAKCCVWLLVLRGPVVLVECNLFDEVVSTVMILVHSCASCKSINRQPSSGS